MSICDTDLSYVQPEKILIALLLAWHDVVPTQSKQGIYAVQEIINDQLRQSGLKTAPFTWCVNLPLMELPVG